MRKEISENDRLGIHNKTDGHCAYCGQLTPLEKMQVDHYYPISQAIHLLLNFSYDVHHVTNLLPWCRQCNHYKRADSPEEFRKKMVTIHDRLRKIYINKVSENFGILIIKPFSGKFYFEENILPCVKYPRPLIKE